MKNLLLLCAGCFLAIILLAALTGRGRVAAPRKPVLNAPAMPLPPTPPAPPAEVSDVVPADWVLNEHPAADQPQPEPEPHPVVGPRPPAEAPEPRWQVVHQDKFDEPASPRRYYQHQGGEVGWNEKHKALLLDAGTTAHQVYALVHKSLPGDLRVRFRALPRKSSNWLSIGIVFSCKGSLQKEDGYFVEWARETAHVKKQNIMQLQRSAPTPATKERWVNLELRREGATISMFTEGKQVLSWTDPQPLTGGEHDLFSFYVWADKTLIDDLVIERNANDPTKPQAEDPANVYNVQGVARPANDAPASNDF